MEKIVIFSGGTGSRALQLGISNLFGGKENLCIITNAYDNGLSTGLVRKVFDGKILGPSDLRKNQCAQSKLKRNFYKNLSVERIIELFSVRFTARDHIDACEICTREIEKYVEYEPWVNSLRSLINYFFSKKNAALIRYEDFSIANIFYSALASLNNNSLSKAGKIISNTYLHIDSDSVILSSDESLFLQAITKNGSRILDEGEIVSWNNSSNPIEDIMLVTLDGTEKYPELSEECKSKIEDADLIIFSSGTQWSSLIPTYKHVGFYDIIKKSKAKKYLIMNKWPDQDMTGLGSEDIVKILEKYLPLEDISMIWDRSSHGMMQVDTDDLIYSKFLKIISGNFSTTNAFALSDESDNIKMDRIHQGSYLVSAILKDYYFEYTNEKLIVLDLDGTLIGRTGEKYECELSNITMFSLVPGMTILTGNSLLHVNAVLAKYGPFMNEIYCDGGNSRCIWSEDERKFIFKEYVIDSHVMQVSEINEIYGILLEHNIPVFKIENRNNLIISIKPFPEEERKMIFSNISPIFESMGYAVLMNGKTTIDIRKKEYDKLVIFFSKRFVGKNILYIGDELEEGNDAVFKGLPMAKTISVKNPEDTNVILRILSSR